MCTPDLASLLHCCCCFQHCLGKYKRQESTGDLSSPSDTPSLVLLGQQFFSLLVVFSSFVLLVFPFKKKKHDLFIFVLCALLFCLHICLCEVVRAPETGVINSRELLCWCWELNLSPREDQPVLFTAEPCLQPPACFLYK